MIHDPKKILDPVLKTLIISKIFKIKIILNELKINFKIDKKKRDLESLKIRSVKCTPDSR